MKIAALTDIGSCRQENQDNYCARQLVDGTGWGLVCDGMGGANGGRVASTLATQTMLRYFDHSLRTIENGEEKAFMMRAFDNANRAVYEKATSDPEVLGMGTTGVCALQRGNLAHIVHAGDSRAYLWHGGAIRQLTRDHSMVQQLVDSGQITREQAALHPQKNLITRALGVSANIVPEYNRCEIEVGDILLLCSDGLTNMISDEEIALVLREVPFFEAPSILVDRALQAGGQDNITVLLMGVEYAMYRPALSSVEQLCKNARRVAILENVVNPTNVGAIFRSAAALHMDAVLLTPACSNPLYRRAIRVSMGTVFQVPWAYFSKCNVDSDSTFADTSLHDRCDSHEPDSSVYEGYIGELHRLGFKTCAMALTDDSVSIDDPMLRSEERLAIVLGTEGDGLHEQTIASCDYTVKIPMSHGVDSLNVAAASAVAFWELAK